MRRLELDIAHGRPNAWKREVPSEFSLQIDHTHEHGAPRIEGQVLKTPSSVKAAQAVIERVRDDADTADVCGGAQRGLERELQERFLRGYRANIRTNLVRDPVSMRIYAPSSAVVK